MLNISVQLVSISAERLVEALPPKINFNVNLSLPSDRPYMQGGRFIIPFSFMITTLPPVVNIALKGKTIVMSDSRDELKRLEKDIGNKKIPPQIVQAVFVNMLAESILLSRSLGTPPPIPGIPGLQQQPGKPGEKRGGQGPGTII